jgi:hypothetical protein
MATTGSSSSAATAEPPATRADIVLGLTSFNDQPTIETVAAALRDAVTRASSGVVVKVVLADAGSTDDTVAEVRERLQPTGHLVEVAAGGAVNPTEVPYHGVPARARALRSVLAAARDLQATVCVAFEANMQTLPFEWIEQLTRPIMEGQADFTTPCYHRYPVEGALTKGVVYPVFRALFGTRLRQPAASEFACGRDLVARLLDEEFWDADGASYGVDLRLTAAVVAGDARVTEVSLGRAPHRARSSADLATTITQIVRSMFDEIEARASTWQRRSTRPVTTAGQAPPDADPPASPGIDVDQLVSSFRLGYRELKDLWTWVLPPKTIVELGKVALSTGGDRFRLPDPLWASLVYDFAVGYRLRALARDHLLRSFVPLYLGWFASFVLDVQRSSAADVDQRVDQVAAAFEQQKPYLISRWRWPERFRT